MRLFVSVLITVFFLAPGFFLTFAQDTGIDLTTSPHFINLTTDPGRSVETQFKVTNNSNVAENLQVTIGRFAADSTGERPVLADLEPGDPFPGWVVFSEPVFTVLPNETKVIRAVVSPPSEAALGYYYTFIVSRVSESPANSSGAIIAAAPAIPVLLDVRSPNVKKELQLVDFSTNSWIYEYLPVEFRVTIKNTGNIHTIPFGDIFIDWGKEREVGIIPANASRGNILPGTERIYSNSWNDALMVRVPDEEGGKVKKNSDGSIIYTTRWDLTKADRLRVGKYTAHLLMVYDNGKRDVPLEGTISFWVIPWKELLAVVVILILALIGLHRTIIDMWMKITGVRKRGQKK